jgi:para-nitrobenzyl esterase
MHAELELARGGSTLLGSGDDKEETRMADADVSRRTVLAGALGAATAGAAGLGHAASPAAPVAATRHGRVRGYVEDGVNVFKGVRYGADTRPRRFMPALPPEPWRGVRDATQYGPASPQRSIREPTSEDCLFLNVWTRGLRDGRRRPVMVYFHGGAHASGSGSSPLYDGVRLCRRGDVVVVTVNHRLNVFGYGYFARLAGPQFADSGNVGNLDLILALRWVRDNIAEFGGDPANVTLFGQSGGGAKVVTLMAMPVARGLFHKAATMSGQHVTVMGPKHATVRARKVLETLGIPAEQAAAIRDVPTGKLVEVLKLDDPIEDDPITFWSVLDHRSTPRHPFYPTAPVESAHIPMIIGNTHDETAAFLRNDPKAFDLTWDELPDKLSQEMVLDISPEVVVARYRELYPEKTPSQVLIAAATAGRSWPGHLIQAEQRARIGAPAWMYQLDFPSPVMGGRLGAYHSLDIPLVFDNIAKPGSETGTTPEAQAVADQMSESFLAFARTGDPNNRTIPVWSRYELPRRSTLLFNVTSRMQDDPRSEERKLFAAVPYNKPGT